MSLGKVTCRMCGKQFFPKTTEPIYRRQWWIKVRLHVRRCHLILWGAK